MRAHDAVRAAVHNGTAKYLAEPRLLAAHTIPCTQWPQHGPPPAQRHRMPRPTHTGMLWVSNRWLQSHLELVVPYPTQEHVLSRFTQHLPWPEMYATFRAIALRFGGDLVCAGGYASLCVHPPSFDPPFWSNSWGSVDVDLFCVGFPSAAAATSAILCMCNNCHAPQLREKTDIQKVSVTTRAATMHFTHQRASGAPKRTTTTQVILRNYATIEEVLEGFDIDVCCFAVHGDTPLAVPRALRALATGLCIMDWPRLAKYARRGYNFWYPAGAPAASLSPPNEAVVHPRTGAKGKGGSFTTGRSIGVQAPLEADPAWARYQALHLGVHMFVMAFAAMVVNSAASNDAFTWSNIVPAYYHTLRPSGRVREEAEGMAESIGLVDPMASSLTDCLTLTCKPSDWPRPPPPGPPPAAA